MKNQITKLSKSFWIIRFHLMNSYSLTYFHSHSLALTLFTFYLFVCPAFSGCMSVTMGQNVMKLGKSVKRYVQLIVMKFHKKKLVWCCCHYDDVVMTLFFPFIFRCLLSTHGSWFLSSWILVCGNLMNLETGTMVQLTGDLGLIPKKWFKQ